MPGPWDNDTERQLLLSVIHLTMPKLPEWDAVAVMMGDAFTASACRQHFQKLRNECKEKFGEPGVAPKGTPAKGTPRKKSVTPAAKTPGKAKAAANKGKLGGKGKRKDRDEDTDDEAEEPAAKKAIKEELN